MGAGVAAHPLHSGGGIGQGPGVLYAGGEQFLAGDFEHGYGLDHGVLDIAAQTDLFAGGQLHLAEHPMAGKHIHDTPVRHMLNRLNRAVDGGKPPFLRLDPPLLGVVVAVEEDPPVFAHHLSEDSLEIAVHIPLHLLQLAGDTGELLGHDGVEHRVGQAQGLAGADHAEFKFVPCEGEGRGTVAVAFVTQQDGQGGYADAHLLLPAQTAPVSRLNMVEHLADLLAHIDRDNAGGRLVAAQAAFVAQGGAGETQRLGVFVHSRNRRHQEGQKHLVLPLVLARLEQVDARVRDEGPVVMFAAAVDPVEGLLMQEAHKPVPVGHLAHHLHDELVVVGGDIGRGVDRGQLILCGSDLVVLGLGRNPKHPQLLVEFGHIFGHPLAHAGVILILQLLPLGGGRAEERAAGVNQVLAPLDKALVHQEILLFAAHAGHHLVDVLMAQKLHHPGALPADGLHGAQQRRFLVQRLPREGAEGCGDAKGAHPGAGVPQEGRARAVPGGIAAGLEGGAQAAAGEAGGVSLPLDQQLAVEVQNHFTLDLGVG